jgi:hypothetical protein
MQPEIFETYQAYPKCISKHSHQVYLNIQTPKENNLIYIYIYQTHQILAGKFKHKDKPHMIKERLWSICASIAYQASFL